jgi:hypothetical protein
MVAAEAMEERVTLARIAIDGALCMLLDDSDE